MSVIKQNMMANFGSKAWQALMSLIFVPFYIKFMGIESYGLIGLFISLQAVFSLMDMGLSTTINRELARLSLLPERALEMRDLVRTLELLYWGIAVFIGLVVVSLSGPIAHYWVNTGKLSPETVQQTLIIIGVVMALEWPLSLYSGGLMGLQRQVLLSGIHVFASALKSVGAVLILWLVSPTIQAFFLWQIIASMVYTSMTAIYLWHTLPQSNHRSHFRKDLLRRIWRFAAGMTGISVTTIVLTQTDKIILSKILPLGAFGYYTLATVVASTLYYFISPVYSALFPRFSQLASWQDINSLTDLYHKGCQFMSVMILPAALVVSLFSREILLLWTGNTAIAEETYIIVSILIIGTALNGIMNLPYGLQLAYGWTKLTLYTNLVASFIMVPLIYFLVLKHGAVGAASAWVLLNIGYMLISVQIMHSRLLKGEQWRWYFNDIALPLVSALIIAVFWRLLIPGELPKHKMLMYLFGVSATTLAASVVATSVPRQWVYEKFDMLRVLCGK